MLCRDSTVCLRELSTCYRLNLSRFTFQMVTSCIHPARTGVYSWQSNYQQLLSYSSWPLASCHYSFHIIYCSWNRRHARNTIRGDDNIVFQSNTSKPLDSQNLFSVCTVVWKHTTSDLLSGTEKSWILPSDELNSALTTTKHHQVCWIQVQVFETRTEHTT